MPEQTLPPNLPPFNLAAAVLRAKGNAALVDKLISMFYADFCNASEKLQQFISAGNYQEAWRLVHKIKGAAILLEIDELPNIAAATESAIDSRDAGRIKLYLRTLEAVLEPALQAAASLLPGAASLLPGSNQH